MAVYIEDSDLTDRLPSLTGSDLATSAVRLTDCITPASAWVDNVFPYDGAFTAAPSSPGLIKAGCLEYALYLAHSILGASAKAEAAELRAKSLLRIGDDGVAKAYIQGVHTERKRVRVFDLTRSVDDEDRDTEAAEQALYP